MHAQQARRLRHISSAGLDCPLDIGSFKISDHLTEGEDTLLFRSQRLLTALRAGALIGLSGLWRGDHRALDQIAQFPDVAGPVIGKQLLLKLRGEAQAPLIFPVKLLEKKGGQGENVLTAVPKRGNMDGEHVEAVEEVLPKFVLRHKLTQVPIGRGDDAHIRI